MHGVVELARNIQHNRQGLNTLSTALRLGVRHVPLWVIDLRASIRMSGPEQAACIMRPGCALPQTSRCGAAAQSGGPCGSLSRVWPCRYLCSDASESRFASNVLTETPLLKAVGLLSAGAAVGGMVQDDRQPAVVCSGDNPVQHLQRRQALQIRISPALLDVSVPSLRDITPAFC